MYLLCFIPRLQTKSQLSVFYGRFPYLRLALSHFTEGSSDTGWGFRILRKVLLTPVGASAFYGRMTRINFKLLPFASAVFNGYFRPGTTGEPMPGVRS